MKPRIHLFLIFVEKMKIDAILWVFGRWRNQLTKKYEKNVSARR